MLVLVLVSVQVRAAAQLGNYCAFFRLYSDAPGHSGYVMDTFIGRERFAALPCTIAAPMAKTSTINSCSSQDLSRK